MNSPMSSIRFWAAFVGVASAVFSVYPDEPLLADFTCASGESEAIRLETRAPDPQPEVVDSSLAVEGGRLLADAMWPTAATNFVLNTVVVPTNVTLTVATNAVVYFTPNTGIKVEPGGVLRVVGSAEGPVLFTAANTNDWALTVVTGGTFTDAYGIFAKTTISRHPTVSVAAACEVSERDEIVRVPVSVSGSRTSAFRVKWRAVDGTAKFGADYALASGEVEWGKSSEGTKYITIPVASDGVAENDETFTVELFDAQGANIGESDRCTVLIHDWTEVSVPVAVSAESGVSEAVRLESRAAGTVGRAVVCGTEWKSANGTARAAPWDTTAEPDGWKEITATAEDGDPPATAQVLVWNGPLVAIEGGRLQASTTWTSNATHLVRNWVVVPTNVTLTIAAGTVVKFCDATGIKVEPGGRLVSAGTKVADVVLTSVDDDTVGGDIDLRDDEPQYGNYAIQTVPGGTFTDAFTQMRYATNEKAGTVSLPAKVVTKKDGSVARIPVYVNTTRREPFAVDWVAYDSSTNGPSAGVDYLVDSGRIEWANSSQGTKYLEIPLDGLAETGEDRRFVVKLVGGLGVNVDPASCACEVDLYDTRVALVGETVGHAESGWCACAPLDATAGKGPLVTMGEEAIRYSTRWANGAQASATVTMADAERSTSTLAVAEEGALPEGTFPWNSADYGDGRYDLAHRIFDAAGKSVRVDFATFVVNRGVVKHCGRLAAGETWSADKVHLVVDTVTVPSGVTLTIAPNAIVKFMPGTGIVVEQGGLGVCKGAVLTHAYDDVMGGDTFFDGAETEPADGGYSLSGDWEDDEATQYRYSLPLEVGGTLEGENRWPGHKTYIVTGDLILASGATLTIEAGAVVKFNEGLSFKVYGTLNVQGTRASPVVFTSIKDDAHGGDADGNGKQTTAQCGDWRYLWVYGMAHLEFAQILYGGMADGSYGERGPLMTGNSGSLSMNGCLVAHSLYDGIWNWGGSIAATNCVITDTGWATAPFRGLRNEYVNCIFYGNDAGLCYWSHWSGKPVYRNCVFAECGKGWCSISGNSHGDPPSGVTVANGLFWNSSDGGVQSCGLVGTDGNIWGDPKFANAGDGDFRLETDSPCIDAGDAACAPRTDYFGRKRVTMHGQEGYGGGVPGGPALPDIGIHEVMSRNMTSDVDLMAENVVVTGTFEVGGKITVTWNVRNVGSETASGQWMDKVGLVCADGSVVDMGEVAASATLPAGGMSTFSGIFTVPPAQAGMARVRVTANDSRDVFEGTLTANNVAESEAATLTIRELALADGGTALFSLPGGGIAGYRLGDGFAEGGVLVVRTSGGASQQNAGVKVWTGNGQLPTADIFYAAAEEVGGGDYLVRIPAGGNAYVAFSNEGSAHVKIEVSVEASAFLLFDTGMVTAPNDGRASLTLYGNGFADDMEVWIERGGTRFSASDLVVFDAIKAVAVFDVTGLAEGEYEVHVKKGVAEDSAPLLALTQQKVGPQWSCRIDIASAVRTSREYIGYLEYANSGDMPLAAPYVKLTAGSGSLIRFGTADAWGDTLELMATSATYPASLLKPGETRRIPFRYKTTVSAFSAQFSYTHADASEFPWDTNAAYMRPSWADDELWSLSLAALRSNVGATWNDYLARMRANCDHLAKVGQPTYRLDRIWQMDINAALGVDHAVSTLASSTDLARAGRGFGLALSRSYGSSRHQRLRKGMFGYGWSAGYGVTCELQESGQKFVINSASGSSYSFVKTSGSWQPEDARDKTKMVETADAYILTARSGMVVRFSKAKMRLTSVRDNMDNGIDFTYAGDQLAKVAHTDGQWISFTYSGGLCVSANDDQGREVRYAYSGDMLTEVTAFNGRKVQYRYLAQDATPSSRALRQIVAPDGQTRDFTYDTQGYVATASRNGSHFTSEIVRGEHGSYSVIAPNGGETAVTVGGRGETLSTVNALGQVVKRTYTGETQLESVISPMGKRARIKYGADGQAIRTVDASGAVTSFAYTGDFGSLKSVTDAKRHAIEYGYDKKGRSESVAYPDETQSRIAYNDKGDVTRATNARGVEITYSYDGEGRKTSAVWPDGRIFTWAYDAKGNCTNAYDSATGGVTMEYDDKEQLTRITYPKGRGFTYAYDAYGRVTSRTMLGGTGSVPSPADIQRYTYDSFGRVSRMTDGDGNLYVANAYDPVTGELVTQTYGNGTVVSNAYDILGRTIGIYHLGGPSSVSATAGTEAGPSVLAFFEYAYDAEGHRISQTTAEGVERYTYDAVGQLTDVIYPDGSEEHFTYDAVGNRMTHTGTTGVSPVEETYTANNLNQYTTISGGPTSVSAIEYDLDGNMTRKGDTRYYYNCEDRLVGVTNETTGVRWSCLYDVFGNRVRVDDNGTVTEKLYVQGSLPSVVAEFDGEGNLSTRHILIGSMRLADITGTTGVSPVETRYYHADGLASTRLLTDVSGTVTARASYNAFGSIRTTEGAQPLATLTSAGWVGTLGVERDSTGLLFMRNRYYDPAAGRFTQRDPIGHAAGDVNWYRYCGNQVTDAVDPKGLMTACDEAKIKNFAGNVLSGISFVAGIAAIVPHPIVKGIGTTISIITGSSAILLKNDAAKLCVDYKRPKMQNVIEIMEMEPHVGTVVSVGAGVGSVVEDASNKNVRSTYSTEDAAVIQQYEDAARAGEVPWFY